MKPSVAARFLVAEVSFVFGDPAIFRHSACHNGTLD